MCSPMKDTRGRPGGQTKQLQTRGHPPILLFLPPLAAAVPAARGFAAAPYRAGRSMLGRALRAVMFAQVVLRHGSLGFMRGAPQRKLLRQFCSPSDEEIFRSFRSGLDKAGLRLAGREGVLVSLSGGSDSVALLHLCVDLRERHDGIEVRAAHFNHGLREASAEEEAFVTELCRGVGVALAPFTRDAETVAGAAPAGQRGVQALSRRWRRRELAAAARRFEAEQRLDSVHVALGHHLDDQLETLALKALRGVHLSNFTPMEHRADLFVRPLLGLRKADLAAFLERNGRSWREDLSNQDGKYLRNRARMELLPLLASMSPGGHGALAARADALVRQSRDARELLEWAMPPHVAAGVGSGSLSTSDLLELPRALQIEALRQLFQPHRALPYHQLELILEQVRNTPNGRWTLDITKDLGAACIGGALSPLVRP